MEMNHCGGMEVEDRSLLLGRMSKWILKPSRKMWWWKEKEKKRKRKKENRTGGVTGHINDSEEK